MTSLSVENGELPHRDCSKPVDLESRGDVDVDHELRHIDVGWPLLRYGNRFSRSVSLPCEAAPRDGRCSEARLPSRSDSLEAHASEVTELEEPVERPPPLAFLKPCRQLEKQNSATRRSIAGQLTALKGRLDRIAEDRSAFQQHSHGRLTGKETTSTEREEVVHKLRRLRQGINEQTDLGEKHSCRNPSSQLHTTLEPLVAPAAAKILAFELPLEHKAVAIPFKWKDAPGKTKADTAGSRKPGALRLPPRLATPALIRQKLDPNSWMQHPGSGNPSSQLKHLSPPRHGCHRNPANQLLPKSRSIHL